MAPVRCARRRRSGTAKLVRRTGGVRFTDASSRAIRRSLDRLVTEDRPSRWLAPCGWNPRLRCRVAFTEGAWTACSAIRSSWSLRAQPSGAVPRDRRGLTNSASGTGIASAPHQPQKPFWASPRIQGRLSTTTRAAPSSCRMWQPADGLKRYPNGWDHPFFFQHESSGGTGWLTTATLECGEITYAVLGNPLSLLWMVNLGCITSIPGTRGRDARPRRLCALRPRSGGGLPFSAIADGAGHPGRSDGIGLRSHCKTSGSRGIHHGARDPTPHEAVRLFAGSSRRIVAARPSAPSGRRSPGGGAGLHDANQNGYGKTIAAVTRCVGGGATVSTPVTWERSRTVSTCGLHHRNRRGGSCAWAISSPACSIATRISPSPWSVSDERPSSVGVVAAVAALCSWRIR